MRRVLLVLSILLVLSTCKKEDDPTVVVNASVADSSMGSIDFKAGSYAVGEQLHLALPHRLDILLLAGRIQTLTKHTPIIRLH